MKNTGSQLNTIQNTKYPKKTSLLTYIVSSIAIVAVTFSVASIMGCTPLFPK